MTPDATDLLSRIERVRAGMRWKVDGVGEYDARRPLTPTGSNLLGIVKHYASVELGYLGDCFGRPSGVELPWFADDAADNADMWLTPAESRDDVLALLDAADRTTRGTVEALPLDATGTVDWWPRDRRHPSLHLVLVHVLEEAARHLGQMDILREQLDQAVGSHEHVSNLPPGDAAFWTEYVARVQTAADRFR